MNARAWHWLRVLAPWSCLAVLPFSRLVEVPVKMHPRPGGISMHRGGRVAYYIYKMFLTLALLRVRRPTVFRRREQAPSPSPN